MSTVRIVADDGEEVVVTLLGLSKRVPDETFFTLIGDLVTHREAQTVLTDGRTADVHWLGSLGGAHAAGDTQAALPLREYQGSAQLTFELPGRVRVRASSDAEARTIITDVIRHRRKPPIGFGILLDGDAVDDFNLKLEAAMGNDVMGGPRDRTLGVRDIHLTELTERRLLGAPT
jgi:hypothetical protein